MLTVVTARNSYYRTPTVVPIGAIDDFARDDGWPDDRVATCGNFWDSDPDPSFFGYLTAQTLTTVPGNSFFAAFIYLGGTTQAFSFDVYNGDSNGSDYWEVEFSCDCPTPGSALEHFMFQVSTAGAFLVYYDTTGTPTIVTSVAVTHALGVTLRWYVSARPVGSNTQIKIEKSNPDGSGRVTVASAVAAHQPPGEFIGFKGHTNQKFDNVTRDTVPTPTLLFSDNFNRADSSSLGGSWTHSPAGAFGVTSNTAKGRTTSDQLAYVSTSAADVDVQFTYASRGTGSVGAMIRYTSSTQWIYVGPDVIAIKNGGGAMTNVAIHSSVFATSDVMRVIAVGSGLGVYRNGVLVSSYSSAPYATSTAHGLYAFNDTTSQVDDFSITSA